MRRTSKWLGLLVAIGLVLLIYALLPIAESNHPAAAQSIAIAHLRVVFQKQSELRSHGCFAREITQLPDVAPRDHDYLYAVMPQTKDNEGCVTKYFATASPISSGKQELRYFWMDETGTLRYEISHPAGPESQILQ